MNKSDAENLGGALCGVYQIRCLVNGKAYVGGTVDLRRRLLGHLRNLHAGRHHSLKLQRAWARYGPEAFVFEVLETSSREGIQAAEQRWLDKTQAFTRHGGYNICPEGRLRLGVSPSPETRAKMSASQVGRKLSSEQVAGMRERMLGHSPSPETRQKIAASSRGRQHTDESRRKIGEAHRGKVVSEQTRARLSEANRGSQTWLGRHHTPETRERLSRATRERLTQTDRDAARELLRHRWAEDDGTLRDKVAKAVSKAHKGKIVPPEVREKMRAGMRAAWVRRRGGLVEPSAE